MIGRLLILLLGLALFEAGVVQSMCKRNFHRDYKDGRYANCPPGNDPCEKRSLKLPNKSPMPCCRSDKKMKGTDNDCWVYFPKDAGSGRRSLGDSEEYKKFAEDLGVPKADRANLKKGLDRLAAANIDAKEIGNAESAKKMKDEAGASSRRMFGGLGGLGGLAGLGGIFGGGGGSFGGIPKCPVRVKLCYRVPCGHDPYMQTDPHRCLSDRRCCFDYILAWVRSIFGPRYMGGAPACYFGPTSKQWMYITSFFQPWNFWYTSFILDSFEDLFNTNAFKFGNKFLCEIDFGRKAYPVGSESKLQCNLVEGCWDETLPSGSQCLMAADFIQQMFGGQRQIYPSLFTNDPADTHCSANWFDFGPKAYNRLPCGVGPPPPKIFDMLFKWCPINDCCLNYASLSASQRTQLSLLSLMGGNSGFGGAPGGFGGALGGLGGAPGGFNIGALSQLGPFSGGSQPSSFGGGFPLPNQGSTPVNSQLFQYLLTGSASDDLEELFCPYRSILGSSLFPDMSEDTDGCCDIPSCYHKKKLVSGGPGLHPRPPHPRPPQPPHHQPHRWGQWSECSYTCGPGGHQSRTCYSGNTPGPPHACPGQATQPCQQQPCPVRARWGPWSECSPTCGEGTMSRICYSGNTNTPQDPSYCGGPNTQRCNGPPCQQYPQWGQWRLESECSATCGHGFTRYGRGCFTGSQQVNPSRCSGGQSQSTKSEPCNAGPCRPDPIWGAWGPCSEECGIGSRTRPCYSGSTPRPPSECGGPGTEQCQERQCRPPAQWGRWGDCSVSCGQGTQSRPCVSGNQPQPPSYCNGPATQSCHMGACRPNAAWGPWQTYAPCGATCGPKGIKMQRRQCLYENGGVAAPALCGSGPSVQPIQCGAPQCPDECYCSAWVEGQCQRQNGRCMRQDRRWCYQKRPNGQLYTDNKCRGEITETRTCGPC